MPKFSAMSLAELTRPEGYDCACGKHHAVDLPWIRIGRGALNALPEALKGPWTPATPSWSATTTPTAPRARAWKRC